MKTIKDFMVSEKKGSDYVVTVKNKGKALGQKKLSYQQAKDLIKKTIENDKSVASGDIDVDKMFDTVDGGKPQGIKVGEREMNVQLAESQQIDEKMDDNVIMAVDEIAKLTDRNNHLEALNVAAKAMGMKRWVKVTEHMMAIQKEMGETPRGIVQLGDEIRKGILSYAKQNLDKSVYDELHGAF